MNSLTDNQRMERVEVLRQVCKNAWEWDLVEFCRRLGVSPDVYWAEKFTQFQRLGRGLGAFDDKVLAVVSEEG